MSGLRPLLLILVAGLVMTVQSGTPITRDKFMKAVEIGGIEPAEFVSLLQSLGVDFRLTGEEKKKLAERGVDARVIEAVDANLRTVTETAPAQAQPAAIAPDEVVVAGRRAPAAPAIESPQEELVAGGTARIRNTAPDSSRNLPGAPDAQPVAAPRAVAVIVHKDNPLSSIDSSLLRRIYTGEQLTWKNGRNIYVINRDAATAARRTFYKQILKSDTNRVFYLQGMSMAFRPQLQEPGPTVRGYVSRIPDAIGYVELSEVDASVKVLAINGVFPTEEAVAGRTYPLGIQ